MPNVLTFDIDPDIKPDGIDDMPDSIKGSLLAILTQSAKKYKCHWTELAWDVTMIDNQPVIKVKKK